MLGIPTACRFAGPKLSLIKLLFSSSNLMPEFLPTFPKRCAKIFHHPFASFPAHTPSKALDLPQASQASQAHFQYRVRRIKMLVSGKVSGHPNLLGSITIFGKGIRIPGLHFHHLSWSSDHPCRVLHSNCLIYSTVTLATLA